MNKKHTGSEGANASNSVEASRLSSGALHIVREIQVDDKVIQVHIHLTEDEMRRLLLPHVVEAFASELRRQTYRPQLISSGSTAIDPKAVR